MSGVPYSRALQFDADDGGSCFTLSAPIRGSISRLIIVKTGGAGTLTSAVIYDREDACDNDISEQSFNLTDGNELLDRRVHQVTPLLTPTGGEIMEFEKSWSYLNQDEQVVPGRQNSKLYLKVTASGSVTLAVGYTIAVDEPS